MKKLTSKNLEQIIAIIRQEIPTIYGIYIFGSIGTDLEHADSDIDLAILPTTKLPVDLCWKVSQKIAVAVKRDVDLIDLLLASTVFRFQIISTGNRIYYDNKYACDLFEVITYSTYLKFNEERKEILSDIKQRGRIFNG